MVPGCPWSVGDKYTLAYSTDHFVLYWYQDVRAGIQKTADFLGQPLTSQDVDQIAERVSFTKMKSNPATNYTLNPAFAAQFIPGKAEFIRKGIGILKVQFEIL